MQCDLAAMRAAEHSFRASGDCLKNNLKLITTTPMSGKYISPSVRETAFSCPHCDALTTQYWFSLWAQRNEENRLPHVPNQEWVERVRSLEDFDQQAKDELISAAETMMSGRVFVKRQEKWAHTPWQLANLAISHCYNCKEYAVWGHDRLVHPAKKTGVVPNDDLPNDVKQDFEEARSIVDLSPRGAAALLRLAIQKLCCHLGQKGKNINDDIASLVENGLDVRVQKSLDVVRVIGNNAVHPGQIDLSDDRDTAEKLFELVNLIAEIMISQPRHIEKMYAGLPATALKAIGKRDGNGGTP